MWPYLRVVKPVLKKEFSLDLLEIITCGPFSEALQILQKNKRFVRVMKQNL